MGTVPGKRVHNRCSKHVGGQEQLVCRLSLPFIGYFMPSEARTVFLGASIFSRAVGTRVVVRRVARALVNVRACER